MYKSNAMDFNFHVSSSAIEFVSIKHIVNSQFVISTMKTILVKLEKSYSVNMFTVKCVIIKRYVHVNFRYKNQRKNCRTVFYVYAFFCGISRISYR